MSVTLVEFLLFNQSFFDHGGNLDIHFANQVMFLFVLTNFIPQESHGFVNDRFVKLKLVLLSLNVFGEIVHLLWEEIHQGILLGIN